MAKTKNQENQTQGGVMNYLNLTPTGLKKAFIVKNGGNWGKPFSRIGANRLLMMMMTFNLRLNRVIVNKPWLKSTYEEEKRMESIFKMLIHNKQLITW